jgi:serine/threonine-protein kinase
VEKPKQKRAGTELGKYRLIAELSRGGMGVVYLAAPQGANGLEKPLVIKELRPEIAEDAPSLEMFLEEARLAARLHHPNIVETFEVGQDQSRHFIAMEYLEGRTLNRFVRRAIHLLGEFPLAMHVRILREVLRGLQYAHALTAPDGKPLGIVHRDVSPQNVFVTFDGRVKIIDFGLAKAADSSLETKSGVIKGKVTYMAPELIAGEKADARSDVFSVGVMLWEALVGKRMWAGKGDLEILSRLVKAEIPSPVAAKPRVPRALSDICMRALAADREKRYPSAADLEAALGDSAVGLALDASENDVAVAMAMLFGEERREMDAQIEAQLDLLRAGGGAATVPSLVPPSAGGHSLTPSFTPALAAARVPSLTPTSTGVGAAAPSIEFTPAEQRMLSLSVGPATPLFSASLPSTVSIGAAPIPQITVGPPVERRREVAPWIAAGVAVVSCAWVALGSHRQDAPAPQAQFVAAPPMAVAPMQTAAPAAPAPADTVELTVRVWPPTAQITINDDKVMGNPYVGHFKREPRMLKVRAAARGYVPQVEEVFASDNTNVIFNLEHAVAAPPQVAAAPAAAPAAATLGATPTNGPAGGAPPPDAGVPSAVLLPSATALSGDLMPRDAGAVGRRDLP